MYNVLIFDTLEAVAAAGVLEREEVAAVQEHTSGEVYVADLYIFSGCTYAAFHDVDGGYILTRCIHEPGVNNIGDPYSWKEVPHL